MLKSSKVYFGFSSKERKTLSLSLDLSYVDCGTCETMLFVRVWNVFLFAFDLLS